MKCSEELWQKAARYRQMARQFDDPRTINALNELAREYETVAVRLEREGKPSTS